MMLKRIYVNIRKIYRQIKKRLFGKICECND
jgi:hypothetical protein